MYPEDLTTMQVHVAEAQIQKKFETIQPSSARGGAATTPQMPDNVSGVLHNEYHAADTSADAAFASSPHADNRSNQTTASSSGGKKNKPPRRMIRRMPSRMLRRQQMSRGEKMAEILVNHLCREPDSKLAQLWDSCTILAILYNLFMVPYVVGFITEQTSISIFMLDLLCDGILFGDVFVRSHRSYLDQGHMVRDFTIIRNRYMKTWLLWDIVSLLPIHFVLQRMPSIHTGLGRLVRLLGVRKLFYLLDSRLSARYGTSVKKAVVLIISFSLATHWISAAYFVFIQFETVHGLQTPWVLQKTDLSTVSPHRKYMTALMFALKTFTWKGPVTKPESSAEFFFTNVVVLFGLFASAYMYVNVLLYGSICMHPLIGIFVCVCV